MHDGFKAHVEAGGVEAIDELAIALGKRRLVEIRPDLLPIVRDILASRRA